jgi:chitinase
MGLGFYGRSFTLTDPSCTVAGCPFSSGGTAGPCSASSGTLMDVEIQDVIAAGGVVTLDSAAAVKQVVWDTNQWVSYDDADTFALKIDYANGKCLGGTMVWAVSNDDGNWTASQALVSSTSLGLSEKLSIFGGPSPKVTDTISSCLWGNCGEPCSSINSGLSAATSGYGSLSLTPSLTPANIHSSGQNKGSVGIYSACPDGQTRPYCCPQNDVPTCTWRGRAPFCGSSGKCEPLEVEVASDISAGGAGETYLTPNFWTLSDIRTECWTSHKVLCCTKTQSDAQAGQCGKLLWRP